MTPTITVSAVRRPGSTMADDHALRRNTAEQISNRPEAPTWRAMRIFRDRRGRASLMTSPRSVLTGSMRVACSAGISPNAAGRDDGATDDEHHDPPVPVRDAPVESCRDPAAMLPITAEIVASIVTRAITNPTAAAASASSRLSVRSCRTMRRRVAPIDRRMPISRCLDTARASNRFATLAHPIMRIRPKAKNSGENKAMASSGCGTVPRRGTTRMFAGRRSAAAPGVCCPSHAASCACADPVRCRA